MKLSFDLSEKHISFELLYLFNCFYLPLPVHAFFVNTKFRLNCIQPVP